MQMLKFAPGSKIVDMVLGNKIYSTVLYETWEVEKQGPNGRKPFIAHIFKYNLGSNFPLKTDDLSFFCLKILEYNSAMKAQNINFRAAPCHNTTAMSQKIPGGVVSYILFEKPDLGMRLADICHPHCAKERICKYNLKDFAKGFIEGVKYSQKSKLPHDLNFILAQNGFFYGRLPKVHKSEESTKSMRNNLFNQKLEESNGDAASYFITIPYMKYFSPESIETGGALKNQTQELIQIKNKQLMTFFGKFLTNMYKGLDNSTDVPPPSPEDNFNPTAYSFDNLTDVFLKMNTDKQGNFTKWRADPYFGIKNDYIGAVEAFLNHELTSSPAQKKMNEMLSGSFFEFISKLMVFDLGNKKQFADFDDLEKHTFLSPTPKINTVRSDTSFDK